MPNKNQMARTPDYESCSVCGQIFPSIEFKDAGAPVCKICSATPTRGEEKQLLKKRVAVLAAKQMLAALTRKQIDVPHTSELAAAVVQKIGGLDVLAERYVEVVNAILEEDPSSRKSLSAVEGLAKMIRDSTVMRETAPDVHNLSDEDLEQELQILFQQTLARGDIVLEVENDGKPSTNA